MRFRLLWCGVVFVKAAICAFILFVAYYMFPSSLNNSSSRFIDLSLDYSSNRDLVLKSACECRHNEEVVVKYSALNVSVHLLDKSNIKNKTVFVMNKSRFLNMKSTCSFYTELRRGLNQRVLTYSLYGKNTFYYKKIKKIVSQVKTYFPTWLIRIYHDDTIDMSIKCEIECMKQADGSLYDTVDFCHVHEIPGRYYDFHANGPHRIDYIHAMMWRWLPLNDSFVDVFASRDTDSFILEREVDSVKVWLESEKLGHIMRDHFYHSFEILGGLWGIKTAKDRALCEKYFSLMLDRTIALDYFEAAKGNVNGNDQQFLKKYVYDSLKTRSVVHDSFYCDHFRDSAAWPTQRKGDCFVGGIAECDETVGDFRVCPIKCRPRNYLNWTRC